MFHSVQTGSDTEKYSVLHICFVELDGAMYLRISHIILL